MSGALREHLVILDPRDADSALAELRSAATVTQVFPPRLALAHIDSEAAARVASIKGVLGVHSGKLRSLPADLTAAERTFVSAWEMRQQPKVRPGEGLSWDTPGFKPPDPPGGTR